MPLRSPLARWLLACAVAAATAAAPARAQTPREPEPATPPAAARWGHEPEPAAPTVRSPAQTPAPIESTESLAVTANGHATRAAMSMLDRGGAAIDAAVAAQMVLTLVEPQSSGIGGGGFLMHYAARERRVQAYDGRETAPAAADATLFDPPPGEPLRFENVVVGGRSVGVPGLVRMLERAHREHGRLPWRVLFEPAIALARDGFEVSPRLHALLAAERFLVRDPEAAAYFFDRDGRPHPIGHRLRNPLLADTMTALALEGADALHHGPIARDIVARVRGHPRNPGRMTEADLAGYRAIVREPLCHVFRDHVVCGMPPPSSGAIAIAQILGMLEHLRFGGLADPFGRLRERGVHAFLEASRLAFADRAHHVGDPQFTEVPPQLLSPSYLQRRATSIGPTAAGRVAPGRLGSNPAQTVEPPEPARPSTSHLSIVDADGNAVALTSSIESAFGARMMVRGFLLNNQLTDFSFGRDALAESGANRVQPGKRPRSSMSPTLVFEALEPAAAAPAFAAQPPPTVMLADGSARAPLGP
ncbi:MAG TPA: gamma-glutamyltransferase family protein, partial [Burkholderiaceae bacterium]|nr:gamma-glutamyltransferase family protein [Burkholderiaceae bacterium]